MTRKLSDILASLGDEATTLNYQSLSSLSDLNSREMAQFQDAWRTLSPDRRSKLMAALTDLAEEHVEYDYRAIFRWTLNDADAAVRALSIEGLWEDENPRLILVYQRLLQTDADVTVRATAATALGWFVYWHELGTVESNLIVDAIQTLWDKFLDDTEHIDVRRRSLEALSASSKPGVERLIEMGFYSDDLLMRVSALFAMGRSADPQWIPTLIPELSQPEAALRLEAVRSLGELEAKAAVRPLIQLLLHETDLEVRFAGLTALGQIGGSEARKALEAATEWDDEATVVVAEAALEDLHSSDGGTFELIADILGEEDDEEDETDEDMWTDDFDDDPLERELRQLLNDRDDF